MLYNPELDRGLELSNGNIDSNTSHDGRLVYTRLNRAPTWMGMELYNIDTCYIYTTQNTTLKHC